MYVHLFCFYSPSFERNALILKSIFNQHFSHIIFFLFVCLLLPCTSSNASLSSAAICWSFYRFSTQVASYTLNPSLASTLNKSAARWLCRISRLQSPVGINAVSPGCVIPTPHPPPLPFWSFNSTIARESRTGQRDSPCHCMTREKSDNPLALRTR